MATLTSTKIKNTYDALLKATDNDAIGSSAKQITDGLGNGTPLYISTTQIGIGVTPEATYDLHVYSNAKVGGNLTVTGDLTVDGTVTTVSSETLTVTDPLIELAKDNTSSDALDIGFYGKYAPSGTTLYAGLFRDTGDSKFKLFRNLEEQPTTTVNTSGTGYTRADLIIGNLEATQIDLGDDEKIRLGDSQDLEIYHSSSTNQSFIRINGELELRANTLQLKNYAGETYFRGTSNGAVRLYYDGSEKLITTSTGISVTDTVSATTFSGQLDGTISSTTTATTQSQGDNSTKVATTAYVDSAIGGQDTLAEILANGNTTGGTDIAISAGDKITNFTSTGIDDNATSTALTIDSSQNATLTGDLTVSGGNIILGGTGRIEGIDTVSASTDAASKGYVDAQVGANNELSEVLANGNTTGGTDIAVSSGDDITFADGSSAYFGDSNDLRIAHVGGNSKIQDSGTGSLVLDTNGASILLTKSDTEHLAKFLTDGAVELYYNNSKKFETTAGGTSNTGTLDSTGTITVTGASSNIRVGTDTGKFLAGASNDLQIYHNGTHSYVKNTTGNLYLLDDGYVEIGSGVEVYAGFVKDGAVNLYYDNVKKFETTSTGVNVTGQIFADDVIQIEGNTNPYLFIHDITNETYTGLWSGDTEGALTFSHSKLRITSSTSFTGTDIATFESGGQVQLNNYGSGSFTGTATYRLAVDSSGDVIEIPIGGGAVDGSGTANYVTKWSDTDTITNSIIYDNGTNVGINETSPASSRFTNSSSRILDISGNAVNRGGVITLRTSDNSKEAFLANDGGLLQIGMYTNNDVTFYTNNTERMRIDTANNTNVSIKAVSGVAGQEASLSLWGTNTSGFGGSLIAQSRIDSLTDGTAYGSIMRFYTNNTSNTLTERMRIDSSGNVLINSGYIKLGGYSYIGEDLSDQDSLTIASDHTESIHFAHHNSGTYTSNMIIDSSAQIKTQNRNFAKESNFGYSSGYKALVLGSTGTNTSTDSTTVSINYDPSGNAYSGFSGDGREVLFRRGVQFVTPNSADNSMYLYNLVLKDGNVGIGQTNPAEAIDIKRSGATSAGILLNQTGTGGRKYIISSTGTGYGSAGNLIFYDATAGSERMRITSGGTVKIGDGTYAAQIHFPTPTYNNYIGYDGSLDGLQIATNGEIKFQAGSGYAERMRIDSSGRVGINTTNPEKKLGIKTGANTNERAINIYSGTTTANNYVSIGSQYSETNGYVTSEIRFGNENTAGANSYLAFATSTGLTPTERMRITSQGNLGLGNTSPSDYSSSGYVTLHIGDGDTRGLIKFGDASTANSYELYATSGELRILANSTGSSERMRITSGGTITIGAPSSIATSAKLQLGEALSPSSSAIFQANGFVRIEHGLLIHWDSDNAYAGYLQYSGTNGFSFTTEGAGSGNVGIGTSSPNQALDVNGSINITGGTGRRIYWSNGDMAIHNAGSYAMAFETWTGSALTEKMRITSGGSVGIGETNPTYRLNVKSSNNLMHVQDTSGTSSATFVLFSAPSYTPIGGIYRNGSAGSIVYSTSSDYRLKEDLQDFNALDLVDNITAYDYKWKDTDQRDYGFVAHELQEVMPNVVTGEKDGEMMQGVDYAKLTPVLLKAIQELKAEIETLKAQINN